ncbi:MULTISPECIES: DUF637 domain-containing protein [Acinetobacter]|uniref:DUF637 domain-containing protein n=1 Tax=Acinetobacter TaxID=469 RepID=UPI0015D3B3A1|nr:MULTISPECIES: DUF637 domain-containing protein [Acinetobacter]MDM1275392.1 DUF637 domain-containing protein [Acinetobacter indicus]QOW52505.1 filamentous hemagglutinin N-terminal domain-containing protein [Acinetobacter indicus]
MNKNLYRIIFSKARNMFIAVGENSKSQTKAAGESAKIAISPGTHDSTALHQHWVVKSLVASMSIWMSLAPVYAQIQADPAANAANRPVVGVGKNSQGQNVPVVNIQTPVNGVSHNIYKQMDVLSNGVVLNNSRTGAGSAIVGSVGANPFLAKGEARLILNEINSTAATRFEGNLEVAGQRADVVIANPAGINIKGGGFINANKAIFTTGKAQLNADGSLKQFVVDQGKVTVTANIGSTLGLGGNNNNVDYVDIYARALDLNAQLHANQDINVITGANTISADLESIDSKTSTVAAPALAVDIKSLGGMYANNIFLRGNEKGLGVTNAGALQAVNNIVVTNTGKIVHSGTISTTDKKNGLVSVASTGTGAAADIAISGSVNSYGLINIDSGNNLNLNAKDITLNYDAITLNSAALIIGAQGNLNLATGTKINNLSTNGDLYIDAKGINLAANSELRSNRGSANINANESLVSNSTARLIVAKDLNLTANKDLKLIGNTLQATSGSINVQSAEEVHLLQVDGGTLYAGKDLNIYGSGDVSLKNLSFNLVNNATRLKDINVYSGKNLTWDNKAKPLAKISGKLQLEAKQGLELAGTALHAANGIVTQSDTLNLNTTVKSDQGIDLTTHNAMSLAQGTSLTAVKDVNLASLQGSIQAQSLKVNSTAGHASIIAHENVNLNSVQTTVAAPQADRDEQITDKTVINADQGIVIASAEKGTVSVNSADLTSAKGDLKILGQNGVNLDSNIDVVVDGGDNGHDTTLTNQLKGQSVSIGTKKGNIDIKNTVLTSTVNQLHLNSEAGMLSVADSKLQSKGNTEIYAKDILALKNITANSDQHLAVNSKRTLYLNADYTPTATVWHPSAKTNLTAKGVLSLTATGNQVMQNAQLTGGAVLLETTNLFMKPGLVFNATGSDLLKNDSKLSSLNGDLSIQTTGTTGLTIDPKIINLSAIGDIELIAKNGHLKLAGYGGMKGNGSEQIVNLVTSNGGINLIGKSIQLDGSNLNAKGAINLVATNGDIVVDGIKNKHVNAPHTLNYQMLSNEKKNNDQFIAAAKALLVSQYPTDQILLAILGPQYVLNEIAIAEERGKAIQSDMNFYLSNINGFEHKKANVVSNTGNIEINAKQGILLRATDVTSPEKILIESQGTLQKTKTSKELTEQLDAGILIDGVVDSFDFGVDTGANYQVRENFVANQIRGSNGVTINSLGENLTDNLVIQGADIISWYGDVDLQSGKDIQLLTGQDQSYDKSTQTTTKKTWYGKKKTTQTIYQAQNYSSIPVNLQGKNILLKSKGDTVLYSTNMDAYGDIDIKAKNIKLLVTDEIKRKETTSRKKSSFWGFKYNDSTSNSSYKEITQLPVKAKADYISTKSAFDTLLQGSEFNYLSGASITAGGTITLTSATTLIENTLHKEKNSVVWQSMQDTGSITETAKLPSFNGPVVPKFEAKGGLTVQVPVVSGQNNDVRAEVIKLSNQPGNEYLKGLIARKDVNWEAVKLAQENWNYKQQGLTGAGAAIIAIVVVAATAGAGATAVGALGGTASTLGGSAVAMSQAAITTLATQASVSLINNGGDIAKTLNELGSKESVRGLATSIVTAGLLSQVSTALNLKPDSTYFPDRLMNNFATSVGSTLVQTAIKGGNLEDNLQAALLAGLAGALQGELASQIGTSLDKFDPSAFEYTIHKIAHAAVGCAASAATKASCEAGAIGAGVGEIVAELMIPDGKTALDLTDLERTKIKDTSKLLAGVTAAFAGYDVNTAANSANIAVENNSLAKLATTAGKAAYRVAKRITDMPATVRSNLKPDDVINMFKEEGIQGVIDIGDNITTLVSPASTPGDRAFAAIDLLIGIDLKAGKNVDVLMADKKIVGKNFPAESLSFDENKFKYLFGKATYDPHNTPRSLQNREQLASVGIFDDNKGRERIIMHLSDTVSRPNNISETFTKNINGVDRKFEVRESLLSGPMGVRKAESTFEIMPDGQRKFATIIIKGGK